jgi:hypothetical protein
MILSRSVLFPFFLIVSLVLTCIPAAATSSGTQLPPSEIGIRQAHLSWIALSRDAEMNAAITYISTLYETNTSRLNILYAHFRNDEALIPATTTQAGFDNLSREMRTISGSFRDELPPQMTLGYGRWEDLTLRIRAATTNNPYIDEKKAAYWNIRRANNLEDFDAWIVDAQSTLTYLNIQGYDTSVAQRTHDVIASKRPDLVAALESKNVDQITSVNLAILPLSQQLGQQAADAQGKVSEGEKFQFYIDQGYRAVSRADAVNNDLTAILLDIGPAEPALKKVKVDLSATSKLIRTGNLATTKTPLTLVRTDLKDLSMTYRDIANTADLPQDLTATLRSLVITLDNTADQMEV